MIGGVISPVGNLQSFAWEIRPKGESGPPSEIFLFPSVVCWCVLKHLLKNFTPAGQSVDTICPITHNWIPLAPDWQRPKD